MYMNYIVIYIILKTQWYNLESKNINEVKRLFKMSGHLNFAQICLL